MIEMFREMISELIDWWRDGVWGKVTTSLIALLVAGLLALFVMLGVVVYAAIEGRHLKQGTITSKDYSPMWVQQNCYPDAKGNVSCYPIIHPESWAVTIEGIDDRGQQNKRVVTVSESEHDRVSIGDTYRVD